MKPSQLARQLRLIERLHSVRGCTVEQLALDLEVSRRTVFRDLRSLEDAGMEIRLDHENRYQLEPHFVLQASKLIDDELLALGLAAATSPLAAAPDLAARLDQALGKLTARTSPEHKLRLGRILDALRFRPLEETEVAGQYGMIRTIVAAIANDARIDIVARTGTYSRLKPAMLQISSPPWRLEGHVGDDPTPIVILLSDFVNVQPSPE